MSEERDFFALFFNDEVLQYIVKETNKNYNDKMQSDPNNNKMNFDELTVDELRAFIGVFISAGLVQIRGRLKMLWRNKHRITFMPSISEIFPRDRFLQIDCYLHFFDERDAPIRDGNPQYDIYYKVRYLSDATVPKFLEIYQADQLSIDESMIKPQGRTPGRHFLPNKPIRFGIKVYMLAEAKTGYIINLDLAQSDLLLLLVRLITRISQPAE